MRRMRAMGLWVTLAAVGALAALSVVGTFRGAEGARTLFTSEPLAVFWILLAAFLVACFFFGTGLLRSPGLVAMHVGSILVLVGAMWGSDKGHSVAEKLLGWKKIPHGYMMIREGAATDEVADDATGEPVGRLPFQVGLKDFRIEYYPAKGRGNCGSRCWCRRATRPRWVGCRSSGRKARRFPSAGRRFASV
jgi:hypothetical protein